MRVFAALISALHITVGPAVGSFMLEVITVRLAECASLPMLPTPTLRQLRERAAADAAAAAKAAASGAAGGADAASSTAALAMLLGDGTGSRVETLATAGAASKVRNNLLLLLCYLYVFQVAHADLVTDILKLLAARFNETDAELLLLALTHIGFLLRAEEPVALKAILAPVHAKTAAVAPPAAAAAALAATAAAAAGRKGAAAAAPPAPVAAAVGSSDVSVSRMRVITELILDLKNNRKRAEHEQLLEASASLRKWLGRLAAKSTGVEGIDRRMRVTWVDIASIPTLGRWWLVGASWAGRAAAGASSQAAAPARLATGAAAAATGAAVGGAGTGSGGAGDDDAPIGLSASGGGNAATASSLSASSTASAAAGSGVSAEEAALTELAVRMRMNTSVRRSIFVALMGAEDAESAIERIMRLNLRGSAEREIVRVLLDCAGQEATYNPYYAAVAARLCAYHHSFKFTFQAGHRRRR